MYSTVISSYISVRDLFSYPAIALIKRSFSSGSLNVVATFSLLIKCLTLTPPIYLPFTPHIPPLYPLFTPSPKAHFDLTLRPSSGKIIVMRCAPWPFSDLRSESTRFDDARPPTLFVYKVARNFFKPSNFVKFRKVDRRTKPRQTIGTGGSEHQGGSAGRQTVIGQKWYWRMRDQTSNEALCRSRVGVFSKGFPDRPKNRA